MKMYAIFRQHLLYYLSLPFLIIIGISSVSIHFHWYLKSDTSVTNINPGTEAVIY